MKDFSTDRVTVLLLCPSGLKQKSLFTTINSVSMAVVIARVSDMKAALKIAQQRNPDILVADAHFLTDEAAPFLKHIKEQHHEFIRIVLVAASSQRRRWLLAGADFVLDYSNINQEFPQIVHRVRQDIQTRFNS